VSGVEDMAERLRTVRKLHSLTQQELADRARVSKSLLSKVEAGQRPGSWDLAVAVARVVHVDAAALMGRQPMSPGDDGRIAQAIPALRRVLAEYDFPPERHGPPRTMREMADSVEYAARLRLGAQYTILGELLPDLIEELAQAADAGAGRERLQAYWLLASAYRCADAIAFKTGHLDLSATAVDRIRWAAERSEDELMIGTAAYVRGQTYLVTGAYEAGLRALNAAGEAIARRASTDSRAASVYGALHMRAAVVAARGGLADAAWSHLSVAGAMAAAVGADVEYCHTSFGPTNVKIHEVTVAVELGDEREALARAAGWRMPADIPAERASHYLIDLARAQIWAGDHPGALESLLAARARAPQHTRTNALARQSAQAILKREAKRNDSTVGLATWMGIAV
jgi:transcriptional regulator with XRE-family HTH domain